jgi:hypothetical protein
VPETPTQHAHRYRLHSHIDGCHFSHSVYICACGHVRAEGGERNFHDADDPFSAMFAVDDCPRCQELLKGAKPREMV